MRVNWAFSSVVLLLVYTGEISACLTAGVMALTKSASKMRFSEVGIHFGVELTSPLRFRYNCNTGS